MGGRPVIIRTLDVGGDKDMPALALPREDNPFLGLRAIRLCLRNAALFRTQLRALLRAAADGDIRIMFPMIGSVGEFERARNAVLECAGELSAEGIPCRRDIKVGMMVEVPAAALMADKFAQLADFFSIGTNDLTQYTLAVDRMNQSVSELYDPLHPAVLRLIRQTAAAARQNGIPCGLCGELAARPEAAKLLLACGIDELSMNAGAIPEVKMAILGKTIGEPAGERL